MRTLPSLAAVAAAALFVFGCQHASESPAFPETDGGGGGLATERVADPMFALSEEAPPVKFKADRLGMSSSAAHVGRDTLRRFIRTADLRFRTKDVIRNTYAIEDLIARMDGHVEHTHLATSTDHRYTTPISADSVLETTRFTVSNHMVLRVPVRNLDTTLKSLARFVDFLDHRTVKAQDVRLMLLANKLEQERVARHEQRLANAIDEHGKKLRETVTAEEKLIDRQEQADQAKLDNLDLEDRIAYSTITLDIYQRQDVRREVLADEQNIERYEPGFGERIGEALEDGWKLLLTLFALIVRFWSVILLVVVLFVLARLWRKRTAKPGPPKAS